MIDTIDWSKSHCGVMLCTRQQALDLMPEVEPILYNLCSNDQFWEGKFVDVKVHMLMPGQFPCIPNWHLDFMPRGPDGKRIVTAKPSPELMYAWMSGPPCTQYRDGREIKEWTPREWHSFTQATVHRGRASKEHCWRCFIRVIPAQFVHAINAHVVGTQRRHSQVYLDTNFSW